MAWSYNPTIEVFDTRSEINIKPSLALLCVSRVANALTEEFSLYVKIFDVKSSRPTKTF